MLGRILQFSVVFTGFGLAWHNVQPLEVLWVAFGVIGLYNAYRNYRLATEDAAVAGVQTSHDLQVKALSQAHIRTEANRCLIHSIVIFVGLLSMLTPPVSNVPVTPTGIIVTFGIFAITAITIMQSVLDRRLRSLLVELEEREDTDDQPEEEAGSGEGS